MISVKVHAGKIPGYFLLPPVVANANSYSAQTSHSNRGESHCPHHHHQHAFLCGGGGASDQE